MRVRVDKVYNRCTQICVHMEVCVCICVCYLGGWKRWEMDGRRQHFLSYSIQLGKIN